MKQADVIVLNEVDFGMKRTDYRNVAADLASALGMNYAYGVEFVEVDPIALGIENDLELHCRSWREAGWADGLGTFDLILCNPPYVEETAALDRQVRDFEPASALLAESSRALACWNWANLLRSPTMIICVFLRRNSLTSGGRVMLWIWKSVMSRPNCVK